MRSGPFVILALLSGTPACSSGGSETPATDAASEVATDAGGESATDTPSDGPACEKKWNVKVPADGSGTVAFEGGALHLKVNGKLAMSRALEVRQSNELAGDFDATFALERLAGQVDCSVTAFVGPSSFLTQIEFRKTGGGYNLVAWNNTSNSSKFTPTPSASLHIRRAGTKLLVEGVAGAESNSFEIAYPDLPVTIGLYAMCPFGGPGEAVFSDFVLTGGAPGRADDFHCDSRL